MPRTANGASAWGLLVLSGQPPVPAWSIGAAPVGAFVRIHRAGRGACPGGHGCAGAGAFAGCTCRPAWQHRWRPANRFTLIGVLSGRSSGGGAALIAVDGKPAKPFRVGAAVDEGLVLQALGPARRNWGQHGRACHGDAGHAAQEQAPAGLKILTRRLGQFLIPIPPARRRHRPVPPSGGGDVPTLLQPGHAACHPGVGDPPPHPRSLILRHARAVCRAAATRCSMWPAFAPPGAWWRTRPPRCRWHFTDGVPG